MFLSNLLRPAYLIQRTAYEIYVRTHPDEPWIAQSAVRYCDGRLTKEQVGLEWGSGRSTAWYAARLGRLLSIEYDQGWHERVVRKLREKNCLNAECRYIPVEHPLSTPTTPHYDPVPAYVAVANEFADDSLDFVVVDGHYRQACVVAALPKIKRGGLLLIDNTDWLPLDQWMVPADWQLVHQGRNVVTQTTIWTRP